MKILCHVGPWCTTQFEAIAEGFDPTADVRFVSGFRKLDQTGLIKAYYKYVNSKEQIFQSDPLDDEVILRCRLLRVLPDKLAKVHVSAMRRAIFEMLNRETPNVFICESVDQYMHDLLFQEAERLGIPSYGFVRTFVNGYIRFSTRGEMQIIREPDVVEVNNILSKLIDANYIPHNLLAIKKNQSLTYLRIYISNHARILYFSVLRWLAAEPYNYHYWSSITTTKNYYRHIIPRISFGDSHWKQKLSRSKRPVIFIPLQHVPEATVDYWAEDIEMVEYQDKLIALISSLSSKFQILIKEHPGVWGFRKPSFYRSIERANSSVIVCPAVVAAQDCIVVSDSVLVWTGSVGFEAALRGKPVLTTCSPYYASGVRFKKITLETPICEIVEFIQNVAAKPIHAEEQNAMIRHLLGGLWPGFFKNDGKYDASNQSDVSNAKHVGKYLRHIYDCKISI
jgi:hypothetical protein